MGLKAPIAGEQQRKGGGAFKDMRTQITKPRIYLHACNAAQFVAANGPMDNGIIAKSMKKRLLACCLTRHPEAA